MGVITVWKTVTITVLKNVIPKVVGLHEGVEHLRADDEALGHRQTRPGHAAEAGALAAGGHGQFTVGNFVKPSKILIHGN